MSDDDFKESIRKAALEFKNIGNNEIVKVVSHLDSDGLCAASIIIKLLHYLDMKYSVSIIPQLNKKIIKEISNENYNVFLFCDLGSGVLNEISNLFNERKVFILDHHKPEEDLLSKDIVQVNPHLHGISSSREISGAGVAYLFSREVDDRIKKMSPIAIVGAIGDVQEDNGFSKLNNEILEDAITEKKIRVEKGIRFFGYQSKPLHKVLEYCSELDIPGVSDNENGAMKFLEGLKIYRNGEFRRLNDLNDNEMDVLVEGILSKIGNGIKEEEIMWNNYVLLDEEKDNMREAREFSTLLNACGRINKASIGIGACLGDKKMKKKALGCLSEYRGEIMKAMEWFNANRKTGNVIEKDNYMIINAKDKVLGTIIGTMASMISKSNSIKEGMYIMSMAHLIDGNTKISIRIKGNREDVDLRGIVKEIIGKIKIGEYGGHKYAAGALVPSEKENEFLDAAREVIENRSLEEGVY
ncbi:MAG: DHH family phosphoesterase [Nanoarchaeota archaeon]|nr:DHH family phosphoesterase [Nanoarchaeota archaeon]